MVPVARRNLFAEKGRFAISVAGVAFAVLLILTVLALYRGWSRSGQIFQQLPGQLWVVQQGTSDPFHSVSLLERDDLERVASVPGVEVVVPVMSRQMNFGPAGSEESVRLMALDTSAGLPVTPELRERFLPEAGTSASSPSSAGRPGCIRGTGLSSETCRSPWPTSGPPAPRS